MDRYYYEGPVMEFNRCVSTRWRGETMATSEKKARSNLIHQWKKENGRVSTCKIELAGKVRLKNEGGINGRVSV